MYRSIYSLTFNDALDHVTLGDRAHLAPYRTTPGWSGIGKRNRTMLSHQCWFSNKPHIQALTVEQCIKKHPSYMLWVYEHLSINWSVYVIEQLEELKRPKPMIRTVAIL